MDRQTGRAGKPPPALVARAALPPASVPTVEKESQHPNRARSNQPRDRQTAPARPPPSQNRRSVHPPPTHMADRIHSSSAVAAAPSRSGRAAASSAADPTPAGDSVQHTEDRNTIAPASLPSFFLPSPDASFLPVAAADSLDSSSAFALSGLARIVDLHPDEKSKIGKLLQEIVHLKKESSAHEARRVELERSVHHLQQSHESSEREAERLREEAEHARRLLQQQTQTREAESSSGAYAHSPLVDGRSRHDAPFASESVTVSRLHDLRERARAAATPSPFTHTNAHTCHESDNRGPLHASSMHSTGAVHALPPFTSVLRALSSSPYRPAIPMPTVTMHDTRTAAHAVSAASSRSTSTLGYTTDDDQPRSHVPAPIAPPPPPPPPQVHVDLPPSTSVHEIHRAYQHTLAEARRSLSPRRRLDLDSAVSSPNRERPAFAASQRLLSQSSDHDDSPRQSPVLHSSSPAKSMPPSVSLLPTAVSGVTRALAASSPEQIERRARQLAEEMFEQRMAEERQQKQQRSTTARISLTSDEESSHARSGTPSRSQSSVPSLSDFFHAHPLTSSLSPMRQKGRDGDHRRRTSQTHMYESSQAEARSRSPSPPARPRAEPSAVTAQLPPSGLASSMLQKSMQLAQSYAAERRARSEVASSTIASSLSSSSRVVPESPFSSILPAQDTVSMTPTTRKIHRLLAIQNPTIVAAQQKEKELRAARAQAEVRDIEATVARRQQQLAAAEDQPTRTDREPVPSEVATTSEGGRIKPAAPFCPTRSSSPIDTYVPPPFSYRTSSRASIQQDDEPRPKQSHTETNRAIDPRLTSPSLSHHASEFSSPALSSVSATPASGRPAHSHVSFRSPDSVVSDDHANEDAEIADLFHLRSPTNLQQEVEAEISAEMARRGDVDSRRATQTDGDTERAAQIKHMQETYTRNFASVMMDASSAVNGREHATRPAYVGIAKAPFEYSRAYPSSRAPALPTPTPPAALHSDLLPPSTAVSSSTLPVESKIARLHMRHLERDLEEVCTSLLHDRRTFANDRPIATRTNEQDATMRKEANAPTHDASTRRKDEVSLVSSDLHEAPRTNRDDSFTRVAPSVQPRSHTLSDHDRPSFGSLTTDPIAPAAATKRHPRFDDSDFDDYIGVLDQLDLDQDHSEEDTT